MIKHIVLLELADDCSEANIKAAMQSLSLLSNELGFINFSSGYYNSPEGLNGKFNYGFIMYFDDVFTRDAYLIDQKHTNLAKEHILPLLKNGMGSVLAFDF